MLSPHFSKAGSIAASCGCPAAAAIEKLASFGVRQAETNPWRKHESPHSRRRSRWAKNSIENHAHVAGGGDYCLSKRLLELPKDKKIITFCAISLHGYEASLILRAAGFSNVKVLEGGVAMWPYEKGI
jgi:rhodanese-related sulfurtransferase